MWIETSNGELVNLDNFDYVFPQKEDDISEYEYVLRAEKQVGGNGENFAAYSSKRLCFGSEAHCWSELMRIQNAIVGREPLMSVNNGDRKPADSEVTGLARAAAKAKPSGYFEDLSAQDEDYIPY